MKLKKLIEKSAFDELSDALKALYSLGADGKYHLSLEDDDGDDLKTAKEHEKKRRQEAEAKLAKIEEEAKRAEEEKRKAQEEAAKKAGDIEALEKSWKEKMELAVEAAKTENAPYKKALETHLIDNVARQMANEISTVPDLLVDPIKKRLSLEMTTDGTSITRVLDAEGKASALSLDDLKKSFVDNEAYSAIIKASNASGGGADQNANGGGASGGIDFSKMNATEEAKAANKYPDAYANYLRTKGTY